MDEIGMETSSAKLQTGEERVRTHEVERVPAHVWNLERGIGRRKADDVAGDPAEALAGLVLKAAGSHQLHPDADAEEGLAAPPDVLVEDLPHAGHGPESITAILEGADTRQDYSLGAPHFVGAAGHTNIATDSGVARCALEGRFGIMAALRGTEIVAVPIDDAVASLRTVPPAHPLVRAARDLGAREWQVLALVTAPILWPALFASFFLAMTFSWDEFIISFLLTRFDTTLPVEIWNMLRAGLNPKTNAVGSLVFGVSIALAIVFELVVLRRRPQ